MIVGRDASRVAACVYDYCRLRKLSIPVDFFREARERVCAEGSVSFAKRDKAVSSFLSAAFAFLETRRSLLQCSGRRHGAPAG